MTNNYFYNLFLGLPKNDQLWFQQPASPVMEGIIDLQLEMSFHFIYILTLVTYGLLGSVILFNENSNKLSSRVGHWTTLERIYSIIPMVSIACIYVPSFSLLYAMDEYPDSFVCLKVVGRQWYWHYELSYDGFNHYENIDKFINNKILSDSVFKYKIFFNNIKKNNYFNNNNLINYTKFIYRTKYLVQNKIGWFYRQNYSIHLKLFADLHKNLVSLPKITNYSFDSYCLSDYTLKSKYLAPKILLKNLTNNIKYSNLSYLKSYININKDITINSLAHFKTIRTSRLLETSKAIILPTGTVIRALVTASDVIHSWAIPSLGVKTDGIPGRLNQVFFAIIKNGIYYGQCSELCGQYHFAMPIVIKSMNWYSCNTNNCFWCNLKPSFQNNLKLEPFFNIKFSI